jgi:hypothetical protein
MSSATAEPAIEASPVPRIRRLTIGGTLDEGIRIVHEAHRDQFRVVFAMLVLPLASALYYGLGATEDLALGFAEFAEGNAIDFRPLVERAAILTLPLMMLAYRVAEPLALGALVTLSAGVLTGHRTTLGNAVKHSLKCSFALMVMWFLRGLSVQIGTLFCYGPGMLLAGLFFSALPALVLERLGPLQALSRSVELNKKRLGEAVVLVLLLGLIESLITQCGQLLPRGAPQAVGVAVLYSCALVLYAATATAFYFSGRCQREDYDLQLWVQSIARREEQEDALDATRLFRPQPTA